ncbi:HlyD family type I secretion periplasmic adaptor subunit [Rhodovibrionaceae bacterium A322]
MKLLTDASFPTQAQGSNLDQRVRRQILAGVVVVGSLFGGVGVWAATAPLEAAAIAPGSVMVSSANKTIQHLEGGIVSEILVQEGSLVEQGDVLVRLDKTKARAQVQLLEGRYWTSLATGLRLLAERDDLPEMELTDELMEAMVADPQVEELVRGQERLFKERRAAKEGETEILKKQIEQLNHEIVGLEAQKTAVDKQLNYIKEEVADALVLFNKGLERRPRVLALQRREVELEGSSGNFIANIARSRQRIAESEQRILQISTDFKTQVVGDLRQIKDEFYETQDRLAASRDILERTDIIAPQSGYVLNLEHHTPGGVIRPGEPILNIVPNLDEFKINAKISLQDINVVHPGQEAEIRLTAYSARSTPTVPGTLTYISADRQVDEATGMPYYEAHLEVEAEDISALGEDVKLYPGMAVDAMIKTGERTVMDYALAPLTSSLWSAFTEQ